MIDGIPTPVLATSSSAASCHYMWCNLPLLECGFLPLHVVQLDASGYRIACISIIQFDSSAPCATVGPIGTSQIGYTPIERSNRPTTAQFSQPVFDSIDKSLFKAQ
jgi:hypothetical protein